MEFVNHFPTQNRNRREQLESFDFTEYDKYYDTLKHMARNADFILAEHSPEVAKIISLNPPDERVTMEQWVQNNQAMCDQASNDRGQVPMLAPPPPADGDDRRNRGAIPDYRIGDWSMPDYHIVERMARQRAYYKYQIRMARAAAEKASRERRWTEIPVVFGMTSITVLAVGASLVTIGVGIFVVPYLATTQAWVMICSNITSLFHARCFVAIFRGFGLFTEDESCQLLRMFQAATTELAGLEDGKLAELVRDVFFRQGNDALKGNYAGAAKVLEFFGRIRTIVDAKKTQTMIRSVRSIFDDFPSYVWELYQKGYMRLAITALSIGQHAYTTVQTSFADFRNNPDADSMLIYKRLSLDLAASFAADSVFHEASRLFSDTGTGLLKRILDTGGMTSLGFFLNDQSSKDVLVMLVKQPIKDYATQSIRGFFATWEPKKPEPAVTTERMMANVEESILRRRKYRQDGFSDEDIEQLLEPPHDDKSPDRYKLLPIRRLKQFARKFRAFAKSPATLVSALSAVFTLNTFIVKIIGGGVMALIASWTLQWNLVRAVPGAMLELVAGGLFHHKFGGWGPSLATITSLLLYTFVGGDEVIQYKINEKKRVLIYNLIADLNRLLGEIYGELASMIRDKARGTLLQKYIARLNDCILVRVFTLVCNFVYLLYEAIGIPFLVYHATQMTPVVDLKLHALINDQERMVQLSEFLSNTAHNAIKGFQSFEWGAMLASVKQCFDYAKVINRVVAFIDTDGYIKTTPIDKELVGTVIKYRQKIDDQPTEYIITAFDQSASAIEVVRLDPNRPLFGELGGSDLLHYYVKKFLDETATSSKDEISEGEFKKYLLEQRSVSPPESQSRTYKYLDVLIDQVLNEIPPDPQVFLSELKKAVQSNKSKIAVKIEQATKLIKDSSKRLDEYANGEAVKRTKTTVMVSELIQQNPKMKIPSLRFNHYTGLFDYRMVEIEVHEYFDIKLLASMSATNTEMKDDFWKSVDDASQQASELSSIYATTKAELAAFVTNLERAITDIKGLLTATDGNELSRLNYLGFDYERFRVLATDLKVGYTVEDHEGDPCVIHAIDHDDPEQPYQLQYPTGALYWTAASGIRRTGIVPTLNDEQRAAWVKALNVDVYEKIGDPTTKIFANPTEVAGTNLPPVDILSGVPVDVRAYTLVSTPLNDSEIDRLLYTPQAISALALSAPVDPSTPDPLQLRRTREALSDFTKNHLVSIIHQTIKEMTSKDQPLSAETQALDQFSFVLSLIQESRYLNDSLHNSLLTFLQPSHLKPTPTIPKFYQEHVNEMERDKKFGDALDRKSEDEINEFWSKHGFVGEIGNTRVGGQYITVEYIQKQFFDGDESFATLAVSYTNLEKQLQQIVDASPNATLENQKHAVRDFLARRGQWFQLNREVYRRFRAGHTSKELKRSVVNLIRHYRETETVLDGFKKRVTEGRQRQATYHPISAPNHESDQTDAQGASDDDGHAQSKDPPGAQPDVGLPPQDGEMKEVMQDTAQRTKDALSERTQEKMEQSQDQKSTLDESDALESFEEQALQQQLALSSVFATAFSNLIDGFAQFFNTATPKVSPMVPTAPVSSDTPDITEETSEEFCRRIRDDWYMGKRVVKTLGGISKARAAQCAHRSLMDQFMGPGMKWLIGFVQATIGTASGIFTGFARIPWWPQPLPQLFYALSWILITVSPLVVCMPHFFACIAYKYIKMFKPANSNDQPDNFKDPDIMKAFFGVYLVHALPSMDSGLAGLACETVFGFLGCSMAEVKAEGEKLIRKMKPPSGGDPTTANIHGYVNDGYQPTIVEMLSDMLTATPLTSEQDATLQLIKEKVRNGLPIDCADYQKLDMAMLLSLMRSTTSNVNVWDYINCGVFGKCDPFGGFLDWKTVIGFFRNVWTCADLFRRTLTSGLPFLSKVIADVMEKEHLRRYLLDELLGQPTGTNALNVNVGRDLFDQYFKDERRGKLSEDVRKSLGNFVSMIVEIFIENVLSLIYNALRRKDEIGDQNDMGDRMILWLETNIPGYPWAKAKIAAEPGPSTTQVPTVIRRYRGDDTVFNHRERSVQFIKDLFRDIKDMNDLPLTDLDRPVIADIAERGGVVDYARAESALNATLSLLETGDAANFKHEYGAILRHYISRLSTEGEYMRNIKEKLDAHKLLAWRLAHDNKDSDDWHAYQPCGTTDIPLILDKKVRCIPRQTAHVLNDAEHKKTFDDAFRMDGPSQCKSIDDLADSLVRCEDAASFLAIIGPQLIQQRSIAKNAFLELFNGLPDAATGGPIYKCVNALTNDNVDTLQLFEKILTKQNELSGKKKTFARSQLQKEDIAPDYAAYLYAKLFDVEKFVVALQMYDAFDSLRLPDSNGSQFENAHPGETQATLEVFKKEKVAKAIQVRLYATLVRSEERGFVVHLPDDLFSAYQPFNVQMGDESFDMRKLDKRLDYVKEKAKKTHTRAYNTDDKVDLTTLTNENGYFLYADHEFGVSVGQIAPLKGWIGFRTHTRDLKYKPKMDTTIDTTIDTTLGEAPPPLLYFSEGCTATKDTKKCNLLSCLAEYETRVKNGTCQPNATFDFILAMYTRHEHQGKSVLYVLNSDEAYLAALLDELKKLEGPDSSTLKDYTIMSMWDDVHHLIRTMNGFTLERLKQTFKSSSTYGIQKFKKLFENYTKVKDRIGFSMSDQRVIGMAYDDTNKNIFTNVDDKILKSDAGIVQTTFTTTNVSLG